MRTFSCVVFYTISNRTVLVGHMYLKLLIQPSSTRVRAMSCRATCPIKMCSYRVVRTRVVLVPYWNSSCIVPCAVPVSCHRPPCSLVILANFQSNQLELLSLLSNLVRNNSNVSMLQLCDNENHTTSSLQYKNCLKM